MNLQRFIWTREESFGSDILIAILGHPLLQELEIDGRHNWNYDTSILPQLTSIRRIKLVTPSWPIIEALPAWLESLADPLQSLSIVYKVNTALDVHLTRMLNPKNTELCYCPRLAPRADF